MRAKLSGTDEERIRDLYWRSGFSLREIGELYGVWKTTVQDWMRELGIPTRTMSEAAKVSYKRGRINARTIHPKLSPSPALAYIFGVVLGDGCVSKGSKNHSSHYYITLNVTDELFAKSFCDALEKIGIHPKIYGYWRTYRNQKSPRRVWYVRARSKVFYEWYKSLSLADIESLTRQFLEDFTRGFYESEGSFNLRSRQVTITNTNKDVIELVKKLIEQLGFSVSMFRPYNGSNGRKTSYTISVLGSFNRKLEFIRQIEPCTKIPFFM